MSINEEDKLLIDTCCKYMVLFAFTIYIGWCVWETVTTGRKLDIPDFLIALFVLVFQYFFRRAPEKNNKGGKEQ